MKNVCTLILTALLPMMAGAQNLVVFDASGLENDKNAAHYAIFTEKYSESEECYVLSEKIGRYLAAHAFETDEKTKSEAEAEWNETVKELEASIEKFTREGNKEMAEMYRNTLSEMKKARKEVEEMLGQASDQAREGAEGLDPKALLLEVRKNAVGQRLFHSAELLCDGLLAKVRDKSWEEAGENAWGVMDANGRILIPCRYEMINSWGNIIIAYRVISWDKDQWEVRLYRPDGSSASDQTFFGARGNDNIFTGVNSVSVRFKDGGWGLIDEDGRVIT